MKIGRIFLRGKTKAEGQVLFSQSMIGMVLLSFTENTVQTLKGICLFTGGHILFESSHTYFLKNFFFFSIYPIRDHQLYYNYINIIYKCLFKFLDFVLFICKQQKKTHVTTYVSTASVQYLVVCISFLQFSVTFNPSHQSLSTKSPIPEGQTIFFVDFLPIWFKQVQASQEKKKKQEKVG